MNVNGVWIGSVAEPMELKEVCKEGNRVIKIPSGISRINVSEGCELVGEHFKLPTHYRSGVTKLDVEISKTSSYLYPNFPEIANDWKDIDVPHANVFPMEDLKFYESHIKLLKGHESSTHWHTSLTLIMLLVLALYLIYRVYMCQKVVCLRKVRAVNPTPVAVSFHKAQERVELNKLVVKGPQSASGNKKVFGPRGMTAEGGSTLPRFGSQVLPSLFGKKPPATPPPPTPVGNTRPPTPVPTHFGSRDKSKSLDYEEMGM